MKLLRASLRALKAGEVLAILLFASVFLGVLNGQLGQPTTLGFTAALAGLCLAAARGGTTTEEVEPEEEELPRALPRRSVFADRIHRRCQPAPITPMVLLIGNYPLDRQQSMQRFTNMMLQGLTAAGIPAEVAAPSPVLGKFFGADNFIGKWFAYLDKFVFFPRALRKRLRGQSAVVHICDHSNAMYHASAGNLPVVVTCHDLIAVRSALGEELHCPVSFTGRLLQRWILRSLRRADAVVCVSNATRDDAEGLVSRDNPSPKLETIHNGLNYPYQKLTPEDAVARLNSIPGLALPFVLHVGSNLPRKNRDAVLRIFARTKDKWNARLVFAGDALDSDQRLLSEQLKIADRVIEIKDAQRPATRSALQFRDCAVVPVAFGRIWLANY